MTFPVVRATHVRYLMVLLTMTVAILLYLDRICLSILGGPISSEFGLSNYQLGLLFSAFFWTYALFQLPAGWLGDRVGPRKMLTTYLVLWSSCTLCMGFATGFASLFILRLGCGLFEAGGYPLAAAVVRRWVPAANRGLASGVVAVGGRLGGTVAPVLTTYLVMTSEGADIYREHGFGTWRVPFVFYGLAGILVAVIFYRFYRDHPRKHPAVNSAEVSLIEGPSYRETLWNDSLPPEMPSSSQSADEAGIRAPGKVGSLAVVPTAFSLPDRKVIAGPPLTRRPSTQLPIVEMLRSRSLWLNSLTQFGSNFSWVFLITLLPKYFEEVFGIPREGQSWIQTATLFVGIGGMLMGGLLTDWVTARLGRRWGRSLPVAAARGVVGLAFLACLGLDSWLAVTVAMCVVAFATDLSNPAAWAYGQDVGGRHVGAIIGWANMWGNLGAALSPIILTYAAGWRAAFLMCVGVQVVAGLAALGIDASKPIVVDGSDGEVKAL